MLKSYLFLHTSSFDCILSGNDNQTFKLYTTMPLNVYLRGLCGLFAVWNSSRKIFFEIQSVVSIKDQREYKGCVRVPFAAAGTVEKPTTLSMSLPLKWKISFVNGRRSSSRQYVPKVHIPTGKGRPFCVDFYTHET